MSQNNIPMMRGKELDEFAWIMGLKRRKRFWFFKESDNSLRSRLECRVCQLCHTNLVVPGVKVAK